MTEELKLVKRKEICKEIQTLVRSLARNRRRHKIQQILTDFRGLKDIQAVKGIKTVREIASIKDREGSEKTSKAEIADIFAEFYETLYQSRFSEDPTRNASPEGPAVDAASMEELLDALSGMQRRKARDEAGIIAEMVKDSSIQFLQATLDLFNDILSGKLVSPANWKHTKLIVIFKKGDPKIAGNYRPIAILPVMYKLFSRIVCNRLLQFIIPAQGVEQAAYRKGYSTEDHLLTVTLMIEKSKEFNVPLWIALVDFTKAFDTIEHAPLWAVLREKGVPDQYVNLLKHLYGDQHGYVQAGVPSRSFRISRGVKQGDPISSLLFIAVTQACFSKLEDKWHKLNQRRAGLQFGIEIQPGCRNLTDLRFADDVLLFAQQRSDIEKMLQHLSHAAAGFGLEINFDKTKVLTWDAAASGSTSVRVGAHDVGILSEMESDKYLGRKLTMHMTHEAELDHRLAAAWAAFHSNKGELCNKHYKIEDRLKLFQSVVSPVALYACSTWALKQTMERKLHTAWRQMLRYVFRIHRCRPNGSDEGAEPWVDFVQRAAHKAEELALHYGLESWVRTCRRRKWRLASKLVNESEDKWSKKVLDWKPVSRRNRQRPCMRWHDQIEQFAGGNWRVSAEDAALWRSLEEGFANNMQ